jgi:Big-like domain-containing protein
MSASVTKTTTMLSSLLNPSTYGQAVTLSAVVTSKLGAPPNGEDVTFMHGKTLLGTGALSGGTATFATSTLAGGTATVTSVYAGDANFGGSTSNAVKQVVIPATTMGSL